MPVSTSVRFAAPTTVLAARREIATCRDLEGRLLGVASRSGLSPALLARYLEQRCGRAAPELLIIPDSTGRVAALMAGAIDAMVVPGEEFLKLEQAAPGRFHVLIRTPGSFPGSRSMACTRAATGCARDRSLAKAFLRAPLEAERRLMADPDLLFDESVRRLALDPPTARAVGEVHLQAGIWDGNGGLTPENIRDTLDFLTRSGALPAGLSVEDVADLSYLHAVLAEIGRR